MKVYCYICTANHREPPNYRELPDDVELGPGFRFACSACLPKGDATKPTKLKAHARRMRGDADQQSDSPAIIVEEEFRGGSTPNVAKSPPSRSTEQAHREITREERDQAIEAFLPKVKKMAERYAKRHGLNEGDCFQEGMLGLLSAASRHGKTLTAPYAKAAIHGALFHFLERELAGRGTVLKEVETETGEVEKHKKQWVTLARPVRLDMRDAELLDESNKDWKARGRRSQTPRHRPIADLKSPDPYSAILAAEVADAIRHLPALSQKVLRLNLEGLTVREIADVLKMNRSRVQRILDKAKEEIRKKFETKSKIRTYTQYRDVSSSVAARIPTAKAA